MTAPRPADTPLVLGPMPVGRRMTTIDEQLVRAPLDRIFALSADVERWPSRRRSWKRTKR
jgi:hypothetical protein